MKVAVLRSDDGVAMALEIDTSAIDPRRIVGVLERVPGVSRIERKFSYDTPVEFWYEGRGWVVHQPFGDSRDYRIFPPGDVVPEEHYVPLQAAFARHRSLARRLFDWCLRRSG